MNLSDLNEFYKKTSYSDIHGSEIFFTIMIFGICICFLLYFWIMSKKHILKKNWIESRCDPRVLPFAGFINKEGSGLNSIEYTIKNFQGCTNNILERISGFYLKPIHYIVKIIQSTLSQYVSIINNVRKTFLKLRNNITEIVKKIYTSIVALMLPLMELLVRVKIIFDKSVGALIAGLYTAISLYLNMKSIATFVINNVIHILWISFGIIVAILWMPFGWGIAAAALAIYTVQLALTIMFQIFMARVFKMSPRILPGIPTCFDKDTEIVLKNGRKKKISNLKIGDELIDGGRVTASFVSATRDQELYNLDGILVTGEHKMYHYNLGLIKVKNHPESILVEDYRKELLYCVNTTTKNIPIKNYIFTDWDELDNFDLYYLEQNSNISNKLSREFNLSDIHSNLDVGFTDDTKLELEDGRTILLKDVEVNDILKNGEIVHSVVKIDTKDIISIKEYNLTPETSIKCSSNVLIKSSEDIENVNVDTLAGNNCKSSKYLYNLVTDKGYFNINDVCVYDYNSGLDQYLK